MWFHFFWCIIDIDTSRTPFFIHKNSCVQLFYKFSKYGSYFTYLGEFQQFGMGWWWIGLVLNSPLPVYAGRVRPTHHPHIVDPPTRRSTNHPATPPPISRTQIARFHHFRYRGFWGEFIHRDENELAHKLQLSEYYYF